MFKDKVAIVTGASSGIGRETALRLGKGGAPDTTVRRHAAPHSALASLMEYAKSLSFNSEDATDVVEFLGKNLPLEGCSFIEMDMAQSRLHLIMETQALDQDAITEKLDSYNMGIVK